MIKTVVKFPPGVVIVLDHKGEQIPEYQGSYERVRALILKDAPDSARFYHAVFNLTETPTPREEW